MTNTNLGELILLAVGGLLGLWRVVVMEVLAPPEVGLYAELIKPASVRVRAKLADLRRQVRSVVSR